MDRLVIGCGYLGHRVARRWRMEGHRVFVTTRSNERAAAFREQSLEPVVCDVLERARLTSLPAGATVLYAIGFDRAAGRPMRQVYVEGLANVVDLLPAPAKFLYVSSTSVYGQCHGEEVDEDAATEPQDESGRVVREAEELLRTKLPGAVVLRFAGIYGPGRLLRRQAIEGGEPLAADPDGWLNLIHVEDGVTAVLAAQERGRPGRICNVCDDLPVRRRDFYTCLARLLGAPQPRFVPGPAGANRRIVNRRLHDELGVRLRYPSYEEGLAAAIGPA